MNTEKINAIKALRITENPKEKFNTLLGLYLKAPGRPESQARYFNKVGYSKATLSALEYDVKKIYGIRDNDLHDTVILKKVEAASKNTTEAKKTTKELLLAFDPEAKPEDLKKAVHELDDRISGISMLLPGDIPEWPKGITGNKMRKEFLADLGVTEIPKSNKELDAAIEAIHKEKTDNAYGYAVSNIMNAKESVIQANNVKADLKGPETKVPAERGLTIRKQFPFLNKKDCPDKLKVLVADMITAWYQYLDSNTELKATLDSATEEERFALAKDAIENWEENKLIRAELDHYQEHGEILGNHPIFADEMLQLKVDGLSEADAMKQRNNLRSYISRDSKKVKKIQDPEKKKKAEEKVAEWQKELTLIEKRLGDGQE